MISRTDARKYIDRWEPYRKNLERDVAVPKEDPKVQKERIQKLKENFVEFCKYYFPNYCQAEFAKFQVDFANKVINARNIYIVRAWAREHAKSVIAGLFIPAYLKFTGGLDNMLLVSHSFDQACELLMPLMINLESNARLIHDFGRQKSWRGWEVGRFITADGKSFRALGAGQSPRGTRNEEKRPDFILIDDIDTDEEGRNQDRIDKKWQWIEKALFPAMSIEGKKRFVVVGNIISPESIVVKASRMADDFQVINILDKNGNPSWKERYTLIMVNYMLSKISYAAGQSEYFNNPIREGTVFKEMRYGKVPPLNKFKFLVCYTDPSYKASAKNDFKSTWLIGELDGVFYIIKGFLEQNTTMKMVEWHYDIQDYVGDKSSIYFYIEKNLNEEDIRDKFISKAKEMKRVISVNFDDRAKPEKFTRIESTLQPLNYSGQLILNEAEKTNPHMVRLEGQFKSITPALSGHDDGPDSIEGGVWIINNKLRVMAPVKIGTYGRSSKKY